jgi:hypothetical protein
LSELSTFTSVGLADMARLGATRTAVDGVGGSLLWARPDLVLDALDVIGQA